MKRMAGQRSVRLWAPWRLEYIKAGMSDECIFCTLGAAADDGDHQVLARGEHVFALLNAGLKARDFKARAEGPGMLSLSDAAL